RFDCAICCALVSRAEPREIELPKRQLILLELGSSCHDLRMANSRDMFVLGDRSSARSASDDKGDDSLENQGEIGFRASLKGATLPDLVQMECLALSDAAFRITSQNKIGYLFFQRGQIVHALTGDLIGEPAALEILKWQRGVFEPCNVAWPDAPTIQS